MLRSSWALVILLVIFPGCVFGFVAMVKDIRTTGPNQPSSPQYITPAGRVAYFSADDGVHGRELW
ncbi:MAG TPA: hypothetical protein VLR94_01405, partial [Acidobacteriota bacterium]|nr:hypothetical protein [Acidobacteriota bacterium]